jgi:histone H3/H4
VGYISRYDVEQLIRSSSPSKIRIDEDATEELVSIIEKRMENIVEKAVFIAMSTNDVKRRKNKKVKLTKTDIHIAASAL